MENRESTAIVLRDIEKRYGELIAVRGVSLTIENGELFGLLGINGAGKTTLIKMLSCLQKPTSGEATLGGHSILCEAEAVKRIVSVSPQETAIAPNLTVRENLMLMARIYGADPASAKERVTAVLSDFSLTELAERRAKTLSGGWQRRLSLAMALISAPQILFLDEPTLGLDVLARRELWRIIEGLRGKVTVVLTTHYLEEAEALCDRIAVMVKGQIRALGTAAELMRATGKDRFEDAFVALAEEVIS